MKTLAQTIQRANLYVERVKRLQNETGILVRSIAAGEMQKQSDVKQKSFGTKTGMKKTQKKAEVKKMMRMVVTMTRMVVTMTKKNKKKKNLKTGKELQMYISCDNMQPPGSIY